MSALTQFTGGRRVATIVNANSAGSTQQRIDPANALVACKLYSSSSVSANTLQTMLSITGRGVLNIVGAYVGNTTSRTVRIKITVDGTAIFDATSSAITTSGYGMIALGLWGSSYADPVIPQPVRFYTSCLVEIASSVLNDSTNITTGINYETDV